MIIYKRLCDGSGVNTRLLNSGGFLRICRFISSNEYVGEECECSGRLGLGSGSIHLIGIERNDLSLEPSEFIIRHSGDGFSCIGQIHTL